MVLEYAVKACVCRYQVITNCYCVNYRSRISCCCLVSVTLAMLRVPSMSFLLHLIITELQQAHYIASVEYQKQKGDVHVSFQTWLLVTVKFL